MTAKRKPIKVFAFIDTNIFLDFYRSKNEMSLSLLKKLEGVKENIICTYQVEMEFLKNRQRAIIDNASHSKLDIEPLLPAVMDDSNLSSSLKKYKKDLDQKKKKLKKRVESIIEKPTTNDPVYKALQAIFKSENGHVLTRDMKIRHKIKRLAWRRFILGYPPRKSNDTSIADALNWEWLVHCAKEIPGKYIIVSRDSDFGATFNDSSFLNDALKAEFIDRVGRKSIRYSTKLSHALKMMEVSVTNAEVETEDKEFTRQPINRVNSELTAGEFREISNSAIEKLMLLITDGVEKDS